MNNIESSQAYHLLMRAPVAICLLSVPGFVIEMVNPPMLEIWDRKADIVGKKLTDVFTEVHQQGFARMLERVVATGEVVTVKEREAVIIRNGHRDHLFANFVFQPNYDANGIITGVLAVATEVTEQVLARNKIAQAEETSRLAVDAASLGAYEVNMETGHITASPRFNEIFGLNSATRHADYAALIHPDDNLLRKQAHENSLVTGNLSYEARIIRPDGNERWIKATGRLLYDNNHKPARLLGIVQDITEQKRFSTHLTTLIADRTNELEIANQRLARSNAELEQFAFVTSHDLQEPLRKIQMFSSILLEKSAGHDDLRQYTRKIADSAKRMTTLITDLLEYSRLSDVAPDFTDVNLNDLFDQIRSDFELLIEQKNATVSVEPLLPVPGIKSQLSQLFYNLVGNALKFSAQNRVPAIHVRGEVVVRPGEDGSEPPKYYRVDVQDNGIGFDQQYAEKIFVVFQRLSSAATYSGHGIGLAICNKIATNHNGLIYANGIPGEGATFSVLLPLKH
ncbi:MAG: PAS domain S-box protein [Chitinophagaceae bacterium]|nr:MAG: PAS domain S-box protein [Chitinophagaceae bacterium]